MTKRTTLSRVSPSWLKSPAWLDDDGRPLVYMDRSRAETYTPLVHPEIVDRLMRVKTPEQVKAFVTDYGLLAASARGDWDRGRPPVVYEPVLDFIKAAA